MYTYLGLSGGVGQTTIKLQFEITTLSLDKGTEIVGNNPEYALIEAIWVLLVQSKVVEYPS